MIPGPSGGATVERVAVKRVACSSSTDGSLQATRRDGADSGSESPAPFDESRDTSTTPLEFVAENSWLDFSRPSKRNEKPCLADSVESAWIPCSEGDTRPARPASPWKAVAPSNEELKKNTRKNGANTRPGLHFLTQGQRRERSEDNAMPLMTLPPPPIRHRSSDGAFCHLPSLSSRRNSPHVNSPNQTYMQVFSMTALPRKAFNLRYKPAADNQPKAQPID